MSSFIATLKYLPDLERKDVVISTSIKNISGKSLYLLPWFTPYEGLLSDIFEVINVTSSERIPYHGILMRRAKPNPASYQLMEPEEEFSEEVNLLDGYQLGFGRFKVCLRTNITYLDGDLIVSEKLVSEYISVLV